MMKLNALKILCCPVCKSDLEVIDLQDEISVWRGILLCKSCQRRFPIENGIPRLDRLSELHLRYCETCSKEVETITSAWRLFPNRLAGQRLNCYDCNRIIEQKRIGELNAYQQVLLHKIAMSEDFDKTAPMYESLRFQFASMMMGVNPFSAIHQLIEIPVAMVKARTGDIVVDIATGTGLAARNLGRIVGSKGQVYGLDISMGQLRVGQMKAYQQGVRNVTFIKGDAEELPFKKSSFQRATCVNAIGLFKFEQLLAGMAKVLQDRSKIVVSLGGEPSKINLPMKILFFLFKRYGVDFLQVDEIAGIFRKSGFTDIRMKWKGLMTLFAANKQVVM